LRVHAARARELSLQQLGHDPVPGGVGDEELAVSVSLQHLRRGSERHPEAREPGSLGQVVAFDDDGDVRTLAHAAQSIAERYCFVSANDPCTV
jgi:hypothetical protein